QKVYRENDDYLTRAQQLIAAIFDHFFCSAGGTEQHTFLEKTPMHLRQLDIILKQFPEAKAIEIIRDGRDVCVSHLNLKETTKWAKHKTSAGVIGQWKQCIEMGQRLKSNPTFADRIYTLRYEQLRAHPNQELKKVFEFTGLSATPSEVEAIVQEADISKRKNKGKGQHVFKGAVGDWRSVLPDHEVALVQERAGHLLTELGYTW
ncbi:MAG: hypothetical protein F6K09_10735, partial [Merismopedia sp. SIO2A8]|nr:hypothetical protein [Merismopedia sp. SIO2A8]